MTIIATVASYAAAMAAVLLALCAISAAAALLLWARLQGDRKPPLPGRRSFLLDEEGDRRRCEGGR